jgi:hypothetical protein
MQVYHNVQSHALFNINGHEQERNAMYDSLEGYKGDIRVNDYSRRLTDKEVKKILFPKQQEKKRETKRNQVIKKKKRKRKSKRKKKKKKPKVNT